MIRRRLRAMGCAVELLVAQDADPEPARAHDVASALDAAVARLAELEGRWSRFRPDSELSRLNRAGHATALSADTFDLIADALEAWRATDARFDPTVLDALVAAGYDRSIEVVQAVAPLDGAGPPAAPPPDDAPRAPVPGPVGIELDPVARSVVLPAGVHLDLGGIGKGRAADLLAALLHDRLGAGVCVDLGGDIRAVGPGPDARPWGIEVEHPLDAAAILCTVALDAGAVATSARTRRTWQGHDGAVAHHLIDPATGRPAASGLASVTVIAGDAQWAEVVAKAAFVAGLALGADLIAGVGLDGILVTDEGWLVRTPGFHRFEVGTDADPEGDGAAAP